MTNELINASITVLFVLCTALIITSIYRVHRDPNQPNLMDLLTTEDKSGRVRFDARKCWEAGAFYITSWGFVYVTMGNKLTEWYFVGYAGLWVTARIFRDRERRLASQDKSQGGTE